MSSLDLESRLIYRDGLMLIIDKPAGLPVHAGPRGGASLEDYFGELTFGLPRNPSLAHRLDRDTSGCLILGRHRKALRKLGKLFMQGRIEKTYWAIVTGEPPAEEGRIDLPLLKQTQKSGWRMTPHKDGQVAITDYRVRGRSGDLTWLELYPRTGRTHQLRVHCASMGCPILGDPVYAATPGADDEPMHLLARAVRVPLYPNRDPILCLAAPPAHMQKALSACGFGPDVEPILPPPGQSLIDDTADLGLDD
ncbi:RluA family pseudouridine synthase [Govanella unica]|uniref:RNA pseudouridine synthase n=1 Tax=Govanella unica TaxID=2975056 RepID=A0A9X3TYD5_9PROT|nr:RNA pseudouridine synthase [Govania unica]MDA5193913.1 RNA pseudouridine synthase [Govania unica]